MKFRSFGRRMPANKKIQDWEPCTEMGRMVKAGEITSIEQIHDMGKPILESEIVDYLISGMEYELLEMRSTQRVTKNGRKASFRVVVLIGDYNNHIGIGVGKSEEVKPGINYALRDAKKNIITIPTGCGSWECKCGGKHSIPLSSKGKYGSVTVELKPAPRGLGLAANQIIRKMLDMGGVKDVWSSTRGHTVNVYNTSMAGINAIKNIKKLKVVRTKTKN